MMKTITISDKFNLVCPCCGEFVVIQIEKYDDGNKIISIIHKDTEPLEINTSQFNVEFGVLKGGET